MKKQIVRIMAAVLLVTAFAGILSACASEKAVAMQEMIDKLVATYETKDIQAFMTGDTEGFDKKVKEIEDFYDALTSGEQRAAGMSRAKRNLETLKKNAYDYRVVSHLIVEVEILDIRLASISSTGKIPVQYRSEVDRWLAQYKALSSKQRGYEPQRLAKVYEKLKQWDLELNG